MQVRKGPKISLSRTPVTGPFEPPLPLRADEQAEFTRLAEVVNRRGLLNRVDPQAVADLARMTCALTAAYAAQPVDIRAITALQNCVRGLRRELGLSLQSSRVITRTTPGEVDSRVYWRDKINGTES